MVIKAGLLGSIVSYITKLGSNQMDSSNLSLTIRADGILLVAVASKSSTMITETSVSVPANDPFYFKGGISIRISTLKKILDEMEEDADLTLSFASAASTYIQILAPGEKFDIAFSQLTPQEVATVFDGTHQGMWLMYDEPVDNIKTISTIISNLGAMNVDNKCRSIIHRKKNKLDVVFVTGTTITVHTLTLTGEPEGKWDESDCGMDSNTDLIPTRLQQVFSGRIDNMFVSVRIENAVFHIITKVKDAEGKVLTTTLLKTAYLQKSTNVVDGLKSIQAMTNIIDKVIGNVKTVKVNIQELHKMIKKGSSVVSPTGKAKMDLYMMLYTVSANTVKVMFNNPGGNYERTVDAKDVTVTGVTDTGVVPFYNMNIAMMANILGTLGDIYEKKAARVEIETREDVQNARTYIRIKPEDTSSLVYYSRMTEHKRAEAK